MGLLERAKGQSPSIKTPPGSVVPCRVVPPQGPVLRSGAGPASELLAPGTGSLGTVNTSGLLNRALAPHSSQAWLLSWLLAPYREVIAHERRHCLEWM